MNYRRCVLLAGLTWALASQNQFAAQPPTLASQDDLSARLDAIEAHMFEGGPRNGPPSAGPGCCEPCEPCRECCNPCAVHGGLYAFYESVWVKPHFDRNEAFARSGFDPATVNEAEITSFDWDFEYSPRIELGYVVPCTGIGCRARYWQFDHNTSASVVDTGLGAFFVNLIDGIFIGGTGNGHTISTTHGLDLDVADLDVLVRSELSCGHVNWSGGLRYVRMDQSYAALRTDGAGVFLDAVSSDHSFEGIGPTLAVEGVRRLGLEGWSFFANLRGSLVFGESKLDMSRTLTAGVNSVLSAANDADALIIGEVQLGVQYECFVAGAMWFARAAVEAQYWPSAGSGALQNVLQPPGTQTNTFLDPRDANMSLLGLSATLGVNW
jgi:hypothetical protein